MFSIKKMTSQTLQTICQIIIVASVVIGALATYGNYHFGRKIQTEKESKEAYFGCLENQPKIIFSTKKQVYPKLEIGDSGTIFVWEGPEGKPMFNFGEDNHLTIELMGDQLLISTMIRDQKGSVISEIIRNEWKVNPSNSWDRNYSKNALEVRGPNGDIVLQVRLVGDRIQFQAKMYNSKGIGYVLVKKPESTDGLKGALLEVRLPGEPMTSVIRPIFRYPSSLHLGEFEAPSN
jgi:hypothetical protein